MKSCLLISISGIYKLRDTYKMAVSRRDKAVSIGNRTVYAAAHEILYTFVTNSVK